jgi:AraC-like DNA-binding protein
LFRLDQAGRRRELVGHAPPPPEAEPWVEHGVIDERPALEHGAWRIVPDASAHLLASFGPGAGSGRPGRLLHARVVGARTRFVDADVTERALTVAVRFRPGALASLARVPARELTDRGLPLAELFGGDGARAEDELAGAGSGAEALAALLGLVHRRSRSAEAPDWRVRGVVRALAEPLPRVRVGDLARRYGLAARTLRQVAADAVGLSPRRWLRIGRLFRALEMAGACAEPSWRRVAARCGYHDPPHLTREFRALLGEPPRRWVTRRAP